MNTSTHRSLDFGILLLRLALGSVMLAHAAAKFFLFTLPGTAAFFAQHGFPGWTAYPVFGIELVGGVLLWLGWQTRLVALLLVPVMIGALLVHAPNGWMFTAANGGWEYPAFLVFALFAQALVGAGRWALDAKNSFADSTRGGVRGSAATALRVVAVSLLALLGGTNRAEASESSPAATVLRHNRTLGERYFNEVWNRGRLEVLDVLLAEDYVNHTPSTPNPPRGPAGLKPIVRAIREAFPDLQYEIQDVVVTADRVVLRVIMTGTNTGPLFGKPPTGRRIRVNQINVEHIRDGRIAEHWRVTDEAELQRQLGP
jgi:steroid delta-isomerase-like uncharacterized protein